jgi:hypothetical protein
MLTTSYGSSSWIEQDYKLLIAEELSTNLRVLKGFILRLELILSSHLIRVRTYKSTNYDIKGFHLFLKGQCQTILPRPLFTD